MHRLYTTSVQSVVAEFGEWRLTLADDGAETEVCMAAAQACQLWRLGQSWQKAIGQIRDLVREKDHRRRQEIGADLDGDNVRALLPGEACIFNLQDMLMYSQAIDSKAAAVRCMNSHSVGMFCCIPRHLFLDQDGLDLVPCLHSALISNALVDNVLDFRHKLRREPRGIEVNCWGDGHRCSDERKYKCRTIRRCSTRQR